MITPQKVLGQGDDALYVEGWWLGYVLPQDEMWLWHSNTTRQ